ncbi:MAG: hypothetical protein SOR74_01535 [Candidatus Faecivicinus sp.]|nr:hypothetical protein [Candidatus Faecivicinus sp.]
MKKLFCALLILSLIALCAIAETDYTGEWYLNEVRFGEMTLSPSLYGKDVTLSLNADGTAQMKSSEEGVDQINDGSWTQNESGLTLTIEGSPLVFTPDADVNLIADISETGDETNMYMVYGREKRVETLYVPAPAKAAESLSEFDGVWRIHSIDLFGTMVPASMYGFEVQLEIESGHVKIASEQIEGEAIREADGTLEDGALVLRFADETETTEMRLMLLEDGTLSDYEGSDAELGDLYYYFEKAE